MNYTDKQCSRDSVMTRLLAGQSGVRIPTREGDFVYSSKRAERFVVYSASRR